MSKHLEISAVVYRGLSANGQPVTLIASIGGNKKTNAVVELTLIPSFILEEWPELSRGVKPTQQGSVYVKAMRGHLKTVCPSGCGYVEADKGCYVQHNPRNAGQVARIIRNATQTMLDGLYLSELRHVLKTARLLAIPKVRAMVAGDASLLPVDVWEAIEREICKVYAVNEWLGYTHDASALHLQQTHVFSSDSTAQSKAAMANGWNVFEVIAPVGQAIPAGAALCPASKEFARLRKVSIGCGGCPMACNGASAKTWRVIPRHSPGDASRKAAAARRNQVLLDSKGRTKGLYV